MPLTRARAAGTQVFVPEVRKPGSKAHPLQRFALYRLVRMVVMLTLGWPLYITFNAAGRPYDRWATKRQPHVLQPATLALGTRAAP